MILNVNGICRMKIETLAECERDERNMKFVKRKQPIGYGTVVEKLCRKLKEDCGIECDPLTFRRTYAGAQMKSNLSFYSWVMKSGFEEIGSMTAASELIKKKYKLEAYPMTGTTEIDYSEKLQREKS